MLSAFLTCSEGAAALEGVASVTLRAGADGLVVLYFTVGARATGPLARVHTLQLVARLVVGAVVVRRAFSITPAWQ